ncbi:ArnT family glycosyltransferase [Butyrivibrio sp. XBB1001]|uniref:ArnT family glycosyltransferase n=1 Tax=Butyrivibrio sp. XBB1001 TaxID=1280682 RepID=UPI00040B1C73|nr:glycosyltransferase family 39 protein [Butyrivibrio sp. XBB1001]
MKKHITNNILKYFFFILSSALMVLYFSASTSPLYPNNKGWDASLFMVIGKGWRAGLIPYKDLFDQKGPGIFLVNMIGFLLTGNKYGVLFIQIVFATVSTVFIYITLRRSLNEKLSVLGASLGIIVFSCNYECGNLVEEYINPFLIICLYFISGWMSQKTKNRPDHNPFHALFYGVTFGLCVMSRATNSISVCIAIFFIIIYLCANKAWTNLLKNAIAFIIGTALSILPFMIYFSIKDCSYDFWYGTILFNLSYAAKSESSYISFIKGYAKQIGSYALIGTGIICILRKKYFNGIMYMAIGIGTQLLLMNIFSYAHYSMITFGLLIIAVYELVNVINNTDKNNLIRKISILFLLGIVLIASHKTGKEIIKMAFSHQDYSANPSEEFMARYSELLKFSSQIPEAERNNVVGYNLNPTFYLDMDISPVCRFFAFQDWQAEFSDSYVRQLNEEFLTKKPMWIVVSSNKDTYIQSILDSYYEVYSTEPELNSPDNNQLTLYKLAN